MNLRAFSIEEAIANADRFFQNAEYSPAFFYYKEASEEEKDNVGLNLYCRTKMLSCQYITHTIRWQLLLERAQTLLQELVVANEKQMVRKEMFDGLRIELQYLIDTATVNPKEYFIAAAKIAIIRFKQDDLADYAEMMELDTEKPHYESLYLDSLNEELRRVDPKHKDLLFDLAETSFDACHSSAVDQRDLETKKLLLKIAKEKAETLLLHYSRPKKMLAGRLLISILGILQNLYNLEADETKKGELIANYHRILSDKDKELERFPATCENISVRQAYESDIQDHHLWFAQTIAKLTPERKEIISALRTSVRTLPASLRTWQDYLDLLLMTPPPAKRRRIGKDMYAKPPFEIPPEIDDGAAVLLTLREASQAAI